MDKYKSCTPDHNVICSFCNKDMELDDIDFNFKGNQDEYWFCSHCSATAKVSIRYGKTISTQYFKED